MDGLAAGRPRRQRVALWIALGCLIGIPALIGVPVVAAGVLFIGWPVVGLIVLLGAAYGLVAQTVLAVRRHRSGQEPENPAHVRNAVGAFEFETGVQRADRALSITVLALLLFALVDWGVSAVITAATGDQFDFTGESPFALPLQSLAAMPAAIALALTACVPVAAVIVTMQIRRRDVLVGEAFALAHASGAHRRIRIARVLSHISTAAAYVALAGCATVGTGLI